MNLFTFIFAFLFSFAALAGGKLIAEPYKIKGHDQVSHKVGISIDQKIMPTMYFTGWVGNDWDKVQDTEDLAVKAGLRFQIQRFGIEPGIQFSKTKGDGIPSDSTEEKMYVKASWQLW
jgi:hypothetical protein